MKIIVDTVDHRQQRYDTAGDWSFDEAGNLHVRVSLLQDWRHVVLIAMHEIAEALACKHAGVDQDMVTAFDVAFEAQRKEGDTSEPGDAFGAPYREQHHLATGIERMMAAELDVDWEEYEEAIQALPDWKPQEPQPKQEPQP